MDKSSGHNPEGLLNVNGLLSPPLTPALNDNNNAMGIMNGNQDPNGTGNPFHNARPVSPDPSISSSSGSSSNRSSSNTSSPGRRPASTFTATSYSSTQPPPSSPDLNRNDSLPLPTYTVHEHEHEHGYDATTTPPPSWTARTKARSYTDGRQDRAFPRLSKPVELLRGAYDVVVIGSGYGGGVAASRMARTGESVCMLERGREKWPGEYPSGTVASVKELHYSGTLAPGCLKGPAVEGGDPTGMFHLVMGRGQSAVVANGEFPLFLVLLL